MNKNIKTMIYAVSCITLLVAVGIISNACTAATDRMGYRAGKQIAEINADTSYDQNAAVINGEAVTKRAFEIYKITMNQNGENYSDAELMDKLITQKVLYDEAIQKGLIANDEEIDDAVNLAKEALKQSDQNQTYDFFKRYISGLGITEDQYWEDIRETYKVSLSIEKLKEALKEEFESSDPKTTINGPYTSFDTYYDHYVNTLFSSADVQTDIK